MIRLSYITHIAVIWIKLYLQVQLAIQYSSHASVYACF